MNNLYFHLIYIASVAICSISYSCILTENGMILAKLDVLLEEYLPEWLYLPLIGCPKCVSGQMVLWSYYYFLSRYSTLEYNYLIHLSVILITIYLTKILISIHLERD